MLKDDMPMKPTTVAEFQPVLPQGRDRFTPCQPEVGGHVIENPKDVALHRVSGRARRSRHAATGFLRPAQSMGFSGLAKKRAGQQTAHITGMCSAIHDHSAAMAPDALPIAISVPPHAGETVAVAAAARVKGQRVLAIARPTVGPITEGAAEVLTVDDAEPHGCRSLTALLTRVMGIACRERRERGDFSNDFINV